MNAFLGTSKRNLSLLKPLTIVIGNESCDLDSSVCAIALSYFYHNTDSQHIDERRSIVPVMNIFRENLPLKTEVIYFMQKNGIEGDNLICRDEVPRDIYDAASFILVDHHVAKDPVIGANVIEIIDHRPIDAGVNFSNECTVLINEVGSCATLVADKILSSEIPVPPPIHCELLQILHGAIILDTLNFSVAARKACPMDFKVTAEIERVTSFQQNERKVLFDGLVKARSNVDGLTALQLLSKDLKIITNSDNSIQISIPGFPILVQEFILKRNAWTDIRTFVNTHKYDVVLLMGMKELHDGGIRRDLAILSLYNTNISENISQKLFKSKTPDLALQALTVSIAPEGFRSVKMYEQQNVVASRKQILPIVQQALWENRVGI